jgi:F-type H+-transporting ATPase subunit b
MESTSQQLAGLLLKAIPTLLLLLIVFLYLKWMFFRPLEKVLAQRRQATEGTRQKAEALLAQASETADRIEARLQKARGEIYQEQDEARRRWIAEQATQLEQARHNSRELIHQARQELDRETAAAKTELAASAQVLAGQITRMLLERKPV